MFFGLLSAHRPRAGRPALLFLLLFGIPAHGEIVATYLGNEGVMVSYGEHKILFDPLYRNSYQQYELVPDAMEDALFAGEAPFDGVDVVFVSHRHGDHFSAPDMARLLQEHSSLRLYAPDAILGSPVRSIIPSC